ncbi:MAG: ATP-binding cassette domain-containing protein [Betaproteobacteria bacterium]|nr:ATP-binding cassette domain-containing protein [Betaproteobacteria bacterium]
MAGRVMPVGAQRTPAFLREHPPVTGSLVSCDLVMKRFGGLTAVSDVNLFVEDRKVHALIGPNGAGKTTLFNVISGLYAPDHGAVRLAGTTVGGLPPDEATRRGLSRSFPDFQSVSLAKRLRAPQTRCAGAQRPTLQSIDPYPCAGGRGVADQGTRGVSRP